MAEKCKAVKNPDEAVDTGFYVDPDIGIMGPEHGTGFWINNGYVWGPSNAGKYAVDDNGKIRIGEVGEETEFFIKDDKIYGPPGKKLPWLE